MTPFTGAQLGGTLGILMVVVFGVLALAPIVMAARSGDWVAIVLTVATSLAAVVVLAGGNTAVEALIAAVLWLGGLLTGAIADGAARLADARRDPPPPPSYTPPGPRREDLTPAERFAAIDQLR